MTSGLVSSAIVMPRRVDNRSPMGLSEFDLIAKYFGRPVRRAALGGGDDCALLAPRAGMQLAVSTDLLIEGRHFVSTVAPDRLGHKALAVNLSDLAACGAAPLAFTLALAMPRADQSFLAGFSRGLYALADAHGCELIGGDMSSGPLAICITVFGEVPAGQALLRSGAGVGEDIYVSGALGDARLALEVLRGSLALDAAAFERVRAAMERPEPRVALGIALRGLATSAIDVSDGLAGDLSHVLAASGVGARIDGDSLPMSADLAARPLALRRECLLAGGDDYELIFTAPAASRVAIEGAARDCGVAVSRIGSIEVEPGLRIVDSSGAPIASRYAGFDHFRD